MPDASTQASSSAIGGSTYGFRLLSLAAHKIEIVCFSRVQVMWVSRVLWSTCPTCHPTWHHTSWILHGCTHSNSTSVVWSTSPRNLGASTKKLLSWSPASSYSNGTNTTATITKTEASSLSKSSKCVLLIQTKLRYPVLVGVTSKPSSRRVASSSAHLWVVVSNIGP